MVNYSSAYCKIIGENYIIFPGHHFILFAKECDLFVKKKSFSFNMYNKCYVHFALVERKTSFIIRKTQGTRSELKVLEPNLIEVIRKKNYHVVHNFL